MENKNSFSVSGVLVDVELRQQKGVIIHVEDGVIKAVEPAPQIREPYILPGFVDAHVHVESSMLIPSRFAEMAVVHGTVGVVTDPHEVANVAGMEGIGFMMADGETVPPGFFFGAPSCVPASPLEKSGAVITASDVDQLLADERFFYLSEMMNFPGVIDDDADVWQKLESARKYHKPVDGHAPGLRGDELKKYIRAGISTDHECSDMDEAREKIQLGMRILIREGSAARNFDNLIPLIEEYSESLMFCTDDCHPDFLEKGHINKLVSRCVKQGYDVYDAIKVACINPVRHYNLPVGLLGIGDRADFVVVGDLEEFHVLKTYIAGVAVSDKDKALFTPAKPEKPVFSFRSTFEKGKLKVSATGHLMNIIQAIDGELYTEHTTEPCNPGSEIPADTGKDILKLVLLDRYAETDPVVGFIRGFGLRRGAIAGSVAHDSHHIIAVGCDDESLDEALAWIVKGRGGLCVSDEGAAEGIALPWFGLMTDVSGRDVAADYKMLNEKVKGMGSTLGSPFMTLSFMALTVIPRLKINHNGLFDVVAFKNIPLFEFKKT
jgi:adenine deaminase